MDAHHTAAISDFLAIYTRKPEYLAIVLGGSLAHGFERSDSDVDVNLVATEGEYERRHRDRQLAFSLRDICTYPGGYIDCKVVSLGSLHEIAQRGSDAARYAFKDARILHTTTPALAPLLAEIARFPVEQQAARQHRFACQLLAWKWYMSQAEEKQNAYLFHLATQKVVLFACRAVLNRNLALYPYHKWLLAEVTRLQSRPDGFLDELDVLLRTPSFAQAQRITDAVCAFLGLREADIDWPNQFMIDSEMNWLQHEPPIDDV
jgi:hypothetical protein